MANRAHRASSLDSRVSSVFEVVGSYFCDTFFNHIYSSARTRVSAGASLTDEYIRLVKSYLIGTKQDKKCYTEVIRGVHSYFLATTRYTTLGFSEFVDRIVGVCVPAEYFEKFSTADKDEILGSIVCDLVSNLAAHVTSPDMLRRIIDEHGTTPDMTVRMLQDRAVEILREKRLMLHNKFLSKAGQAREFVSLDQVEGMKKAMRRLAREKAEAVARAETLERANKAQQREFKAREAKMLKLIELLRVERDKGPAAAAARVSVPRRDRIAERDPFADLEPGEVPGRERIAERRSSESSETESSARGSEASSDRDDGSEETASESSGASPALQRQRRARGGGPAAKRPARGRPTAGKAKPHPAPSAKLADFFAPVPKPARRDSEPTGDVAGSGVAASRAEPGGAREGGLLASLLGDAELSEDE